MEETPRTLNPDAARRVELLATIAAQLGMVSLVERTIGESKGFLYHRRKAGFMGSHQLALATEALGLLPVGLGGTAETDCARRALVPPLRARDRHLAALEQAAMARVAQGGSGLDPEVLTARLEQVDELRFESPQSALQVLVDTCAERLTADQAAHVLAAATACFRMLHRYNLAARSLHLGRQIAAQTGDRWALGVLFQKAVYLYDSLGAPEVSLGFAKEALTIFAELDLRRKIGEALIDQGFCWKKLKELETCLRVLDAAGSYALDLTVSYRATRLQIKSVALTELGRHAEALEHLRLAAREARNSPNLWIQAKLCWAEGRALGSAGVPQLQEAVRLLMDRIPVDAALASVDLAKVYLHSGQAAQAHQVALGMTVFMQPFHRVPAAARAIRDLVLIGRASRGLTLRELEKAERVLSESRSAYYRLARRAPRALGLS